MEEEKQKKFEALKNFFISDMKIKEKIIKQAPQELDDFDQETRLKYISKLCKMLYEIEININTISKNFDFMPEVKRNIYEHFEKIKEGIFNRNYDRGEIKQLYMTKVSALSLEFREKVKQQCYG